MKTAIVVLADPNNGEEALGRVFNALAAAWDFQRSDQPVRILFQGAGTRWPALLAKADHPAHALFTAVHDRIAGISCGCADVFGAREDAERSGLDLLGDNTVPGTRGLPSLARLQADGYSIVTF